MTTDEAIKWGGGTQVALAERLGISQPSVAGWGERPPALRQLQIESLSSGELKADEDCRRGTPKMKSTPTRSAASA
jgi:DNA-binding transcriptional regulator YdaS (Cro superfamily)